MKVQVKGSESLHVASEARAGSALRSAVWGTNPRLALCTVQLQTGACWMLEMTLQATTLRGVGVECWMLMLRGSRLCGGMLDGGVRWQWQRM
jgi:hypothetical protein